jgi:hypothetical protein
MKMADSRTVVFGLLASFFSLFVQATPLAPIVEPGRLSVSEPLACLVFDAEMPSRLGLQADQLAQWQRLEHQHIRLFGTRCSGGESISVMQADWRVEVAATMQAHQNDLHGFLIDLSDEQRARLAEIALAHRDSRASLEEKLIRHRLML